MKFILLILGFAAITAGSTFFVAPQFRGYHEAKLQQEVERALEEAGYIECDVKMNHLHAEEIHIRKIAEPGETEASIQQNVKRIVQELHGPTIEENSVYVKFEYASNDKELVGGGDEAEVEDSPEAGVTDPKMLEPEPEPEPEGKTDPDPEPKPEPKPEPVLARSEIYVEWNRRKNEVQVRGKMSNKAEKEEVVSLYDEDAIINAIL